MINTNSRWWLQQQELVGNKVHSKLYVPSVRVLISHVWWIFVFVI